MGGLGLGPAFAGAVEPALAAGGQLLAALRQGERLLKSAAASAAYQPHLSLAYSSDEQPTSRSSPRWTPSAVGGGLVALLRTGEAFETGLAEARNVTAAWRKARPAALRSQSADDGLPHRIKIYVTKGVVSEAESHRRQTALDATLLECRGTVRGMSWLATRMGERAACARRTETVVGVREP
jgi:hypothetical protein